MQQDKKATKLSSISWWKLSVGLGLVTLGFIIGVVYFADPKNLIAGIGAVFITAPGLYLIYMQLKPRDSGFSFARRKYTGRENALIIFAERNNEKNKDMPLCIRFAEVNNIPRNARLHYVRNLKKHFYELFNNTTTKKLEPVKLPDKKSFPPELFKIPAAMQVYKDAIEYSPPTLLQKIAPGILLLAMGIVGILMVMTGPTGG